MHLDAVCCFIDESRVGKLRQVEIASKFAIDAGEKIEVEGGGNTDGVVVGTDQCLKGLEHVRAEEKRVTWQKYLADPVKKIGAGGTVKVADVAAEKENQKMFAGGAAGGNFAEPVEILAFEADNADAVDVVKFAAQNGEGSGRNLNGVVPGGLPAGERFQKQARFAAGAAAEFGDDNGTRKLVDNIPCVQSKQGFFGPRQTVFGKGADYFEER